MKTTNFFLSLIVFTVLWCTDAFANHGGHNFVEIPLDDCITTEANCFRVEGSEGHTVAEMIAHGYQVTIPITEGKIVAFSHSGDMSVWIIAKQNTSPTNNPPPTNNPTPSTPTSTPTPSTPTSTTTTTTTTTTSTPTSSTPTTTTPTTTTSLVATTLSKISGDGQQGSVGQPLANPFVVEVQDQNGNPLAGTTVTFAVTAGGGTLSIATATSDANGQVRTTLTLGPMLGTNTIQAGAPGIDQRQVFSAEASLLDSVRKIVVDVTGADPRAVQLYQFELELQQGWNLIHLPLTVYGVGNELSRIQTAADLYTLIQPHTMFIYSGGRFFTVNAETDIMIEPNQGIVLFASAPATFTLIGTRLPSEFQLERGLNFVGFPRQSVTLQRVSDWSRIYEEAVTVITAVAGRFYVVGRAGDSGDHKLTGGQSLFIFSTAPRETFFYGPAWGTRIE